MPGRGDAIAGPGTPCPPPVHVAAGLFVNAKRGPLFHAESYRGLSALTSGALGFQLFAHRRRGVADLLDGLLQSLFRDAKMLRPVFDLVLVIHRDHVSWSNGFCREFGHIGLRQGRLTGVPCRLSGMQPTGSPPWNSAGPAELSDR